eukprot:TRINITY_DN2213_c0_g1_i2.p1 TRINITY_DN2213_c0_g1~~TRINITY_DN2213_c0_g1_i2.p1  ORF type:complete len:218 (-),score=10.42 TRINITY_DN2213_c0_g1_i2:53-706(-)
MALLTLSGTFQCLSLIIDPFRINCWLPFLVERLLYDLAYDICLLAYAMVIITWVSAMKIRVVYQPPKFKNLYILFVVVLLIPNAIYLVFCHIYTIENYIALSGVFLCYFAFLVLILNISFAVQGYKLMKKMKKSRVPYYRPLYMIFGTMGLSVGFIGAIAVVYIFEMQSHMIGFVIFEIVSHTMLFGALVLEGVVIGLLSKISPNGATKATSGSKIK